LRHFGRPGPLLSICALELALAVTIVSCAPPSRPVAVSRIASCGLTGADRRWLSGAIEQWNFTSARSLRLTPEPLPLIVLFDLSCVYRVRVTGDSAFSVDTASYEGQVPLPNGRGLQPLGIGLTAPAAGDSSFFVALALRSVWRADPRYGGRSEDWNGYMTGAFVHEMTHVRTLGAVLPRLRALQRQIRSDSLEDDLIQSRFAGDTAFANSVARERALLFRVAQTTNARDRMLLTRAALELIRARRARYFVNDLSLWGELEQHFLDLEGVAQWAQFAQARNGPYRYMPLKDALDRFRSGEQYWSQDEGLAIFLALDAMVPDWQRMIFSADPPTSLDLLTRAVSQGASPGTRGSDS
jgi:hypothetical protein